MSLTLSTCNECNKTRKSYYYNCFICKKENICCDCISYTDTTIAGMLCCDCSKHTIEQKKKHDIKEETKTKIIHRSYEYRNSILHTIQHSYAYKRLHNDPSIIILDSILNDYMMNGTPYINKEIDIVNNIMIVSNHHDKNTKYKFVLNLYNNNIMGDTFNVMPIEPL